MFSALKTHARTLWTVTSEILQTVESTAVETVTMRPLPPADVSSQQPRLGGSTHPTTSTPPTRPPLPANTLRCGSAEGRQRWPPTPPHPRHPGAPPRPAPAAATLTT
eukprot:235170-Chlamydomonas_euryale.AAC.2